MAEQDATTTNQPAYRFDVGDHVVVSAIMYEDSCPEWVPQYGGRVVSVSGPTYAPDAVVELEDGSRKAVSSGACYSIDRVNAPGSTC